MRSIFFSSSSSFTFFQSLMIIKKTLCFRLISLVRKLETLDLFQKNFMKKNSNKFNDIYFIDKYA